MRDRSIIVKIHRGKLFFSPENFIQLDQSNLPTEHLIFTGRPLYWKLWMVSYDREKGQLEVNIQNYDLSLKSEWKGRTPAGPINSIKFQGMSWDHLKSCLAFYDREARSFFKEGKIDIPQIKEIKFTQKVRLNDLTIHYGYVSYAKKVRWQNDPLEVKIKHPHMMEELNYVKSYFTKIIGRKTIEVNLKVGKNDGIVEYIHATSSDLQKINADSIYIIRNYQLDKLRKTLKQEKRENILMPELEDTDDLFLGSVDDLEKEFLFSTLESMQVRNEAQLLYLAELNADGYKLMLTIQPQFGFVFTVIGEEMQHFIWELINSHATYVWSMPLYAGGKVRKLEHEFLTITEHGRNYYKNTFNNTSDVFFNVVNHRRKDDPMINHFEKWRVKLVSTLI